ncbi:FYVE, RhoGEF and PH domain-containing protein 1-like [Penaeus japonicus]|uniref:FYVE, RhoGEF and PH domain-containing protein 1-like n=1 Tax=Penaeus japonicus TaxID=27405 RepID=UPI001C70F236|nr:FYVE, RhoGEF and PH domain-containing protein 1-like [Penaeus japonicus]
MASVDVQSLLTNVPLEETTNLTVRKLVKSKDVQQLNEKLTKALQLATADSIFTFNDDLYSQTDGKTMGSPLGPTYANAFLCHHERDWVKGVQGNVPPSQGTGTSALGDGPPGSMGQSCLLAQENGHPHGSQGQGCSPAQDHNMMENKIDLLIGMFSEQQLAIKAIMGQGAMCHHQRELAEDASLTPQPITPQQIPSDPPSPTHDQNTYQTFPFASPPPIITPSTSTPSKVNTNTRTSSPSTPVPMTSNPPLPLPSPHCPPAASQLPRAFADSAASNYAEPSSRPSASAPSQESSAPTTTPASPKPASPKLSPTGKPKTNKVDNASTEASTQLPPRHK